MRRWPDSKGKPERPGDGSDDDPEDEDFYDEEE